MARTGLAAAILQHPGPTGSKCITLSSAAGRENEGWRTPGRPGRRRDGSRRVARPFRRATANACRSRFVSQQRAVLRAVPVGPRDRVLAELLCASLRAAELAFSLARRRADA